MNMCRHHNIKMWDIRKKEAVYFCVYADEFVKLIALSVKTSARPHLLKKKGLPFQIQKMKRNWTFYSGFFVFLALLSILSTFVWEITYHGQSSYSKETLQKTVESMNVYTGMKRSRLDCDAIEKRIREIHPDISWVSAEEMGSVLKISIKEGKKTITHEKASAPKHLTALYDGVVEDIMVNRGTAMVKKGKRVKKGDILISGVVPITDDNNEVAENMSVSAKGEVTILAEKNFSEPISVRYKKKEYTGRTLHSYSWVLGNQSFSLKNPLKRFDNSLKYDTMSIVCVNRIIHPLSFPIKVTKREYREYRMKNAVYSKNELKKTGMERYRHMLDALTKDNMELVTHSAVLKQKDKENWLLQGKITFRCKKLGSRAVKEKELQIKKADGGKNGESGENS